MSASCCRRLTTNLSVSPSFASVSFHAILAEMELQLLRRVVLQHIDLLRQFEPEFARSANEVAGGRQYNHLERCALCVALVVGDRNQQRFAGRTGREFHLGGE